MADVEGELPKPKRVRRQRDAAPDSPDPVEIAMKAVATDADRHGSARAVLEKHACLIDIQCARESEELRVLKLRRFTRYAVILLVVALLAGIAALLVSASRSQALIIEPFQVPPALEQRGLSGRVVGSRVLDRLAELDRRTQSARAESSYANNWEGEIQIAIPETGVSVGEAWRHLRRWLGTETRVSGEVVQLPAGVAITTRAGSLSGGTIQGPEAQLDRLIDQAAESIYRVTQPYRHAISLQPERYAEREQALLALADHPDPLERRWAYSGLSAHYRTTGRLGRAIEAAEAALAIDPQMITALGNLGLTRLQLGHDEAAVAALRASAAASRNADADEFDPRIVAANNANSLALAALRTGDPGEALRQANLAIGGINRAFRLGAYEYALRALALAHDHAAAARLARRAEFRGAELETYGWPLDLARMDFERSLDLGDRAGAEAALARMEALTQVRDDPARRNPWLGFWHSGENARLRSFLPAAAAALARLGRLEEAAALARQTPLDCYDCILARAAVAARAGNRAEALRWFAHADAAGPSLPYAKLEQGLMWLRSGNLGRATPALAEASRRAPRWADPLRYLGDAAVRRGSEREAERLYAAAAERAPRWGALHVEWGRALWRLGRRDEARAKFAAAAAMDLSAADRARLARLVAFAAGRSA